MNVIFDLSLPENRRTKKQYTWMQIPEEHRPVCIFCGDNIPYENDASVKRWLQRKICKAVDDKKEVKCITLYVKSNNKKRPKIPEHEKKKPQRPGPQFWQKPAVDKPKPRVVMGIEEAERLDSEQARLNIEIHTKQMQRCGYVHSPCRKLSREEIRAIEHTITPLVKEEPVYKHYMPWLPRGCVQL